MTAVLFWLSLLGTPIYGYSLPCTAGESGKFAYTPPLYEYCDGADWTSMDVGAGAACAPAEAGILRYSSGQYEFCNSSNWRSVKGPEIGVCTAGAAGQMTYASGLLKFCDGTHWFLAAAGSLLLDSQPAAFTIPDVTSAAASSVITSSIVQLTGFDTATATLVSAAGAAEFRVCHDAACAVEERTWGASSVAISRNHYVQLRMTSSASQGTAQAALFSVGGVTDVWSVTTAASQGFLVLSSAAYDGDDLGGVTGATAECLNNIVTQNFKDKARAVIDASTVAAFLCDAPNGCNNLLPSTVYEYATAGNTSPGGGTFTTDASGLGPNDSLAWSVAAQFGVTADVWMGRNGSSPTAWGATPHSVHCTNWTSTSGIGTIGKTNFSNGNRWVQGSLSCASTARILCAIHPVDMMPSAFDFSDQTGVAASSVISSNIVQIGGIGAPAVVNVMGTGAPEVRVCADNTCASVVTAWTSSPVTVSNGQYVQSRQTSSAAAATARVAVVTVGSLEDMWTVTTP